MTAQNKRGNWIWTPDWSDEDMRVVRLVRFSKEVAADAFSKGVAADVFSKGAVADAKSQGGDSPVLKITADCRYKLYINGKLVQYGPAKGDHIVHYLDTVMIGKLLMPGKNRIDVLVLHSPEDPKTGNHSMFSSDTPGLYIEGISPEGWESCVERAVSFEKEEERFAPLQIHEKWTADIEAAAKWQTAVVRGDEEMPAYLQPGNLLPRPIPAMDLLPHTADLPIRRVEAHSRASFVLSAGEEMCAFIKLCVTGGAGAKIDLLYSECYELENGKADRTDAANGTLRGYHDLFAVNGGSQCLEPFWFRTFRFIEVTVETAGEPILLDSFSYLETGYPLKAITRVTTSDDTLAPVWDISLRTLRRCMHETYVDCPYYEQLQYVMDTRSEILYTYAVSGDDRLAVKSIREFARAQRLDGLLNCSYPNKCVNVIPGFSIYYILMVHDHMMYFGKPELVREVLPVIRRILRYFEDNIIKSGPFPGLVGRTGGVNGESKYWSFIDWAEEWMGTTGMPPAGRSGPITMESLLFILGLQKAAELEEYAGIKANASAYRMLAEEVQRAVRRHCLDEEGFITDGPGSGMRSQHCQIFGVLTGTFAEEEGKRALLRSITEDGFARCSVAMRFYLFRALEQTGLYEYTDRYWDVWRRMVRDHCTTCVEAEFYARSECHAWGALALYELPSVILGVRPAAPGYEKIAVKPVPGYLKHANGTVHTPKGDLTVEWERGDEEKLRVGVICNEDVRRRIV